MQECNLWLMIYSWTGQQRIDNKLTFGFYTNEIKWYAAFWLEWNPWHWNICAQLTPSLFQYIDYFRFCFVADTKYPIARLIVLHMKSKLTICLFLCLFTTVRKMFNGSLPTQGCHALCWWVHWLYSESAAARASNINLQKACQFLGGTDFKGGDVSPEKAPRLSTAKQCCDFCKLNPGRNTTHNSVNKFRIVNGCSAIFCAFLQVILISRPSSIH